MILTGSSGFFALLPPPKTKQWNSVSYKSPYLGIPRFDKNRGSLCVATSWKPASRIKLLASLGVESLDLSSAPTRLFDKNCGSLFHTILRPPKPSIVSLSGRAYNGVPYSCRYPKMTEKPKWWWRTLSCLPYLIPLHLTWVCAEGAYVHPSLEYFEFLTFPFLGALSKLPSWFPMAYSLIAYYGIVVRKECPHFFRFHVIHGMLLESALHIFGTVSKWTPQSGCWGMIGSHIWLVVAVVSLFIDFECMRRALSGMHADIPFIGDAAYMHIRYD